MGGWVTLTWYISERSAQMSRVWVPMLPVEPSKEILRLVLPASKARSAVFLKDSAVSPVFFGVEVGGWVGWMGWVKGEVEGDKAGWCVVRRRW